MGHNCSDSANPNGKSEQHKYHSWSHPADENRLSHEKGHDVSFDATHGLMLHVTLGLLSSILPALVWLRVKLACRVGLKVTEISFAALV